MIPQPPPGQGPVDPRGAFAPQPQVPPPGGYPGPQLAGMAPPQGGAPGQPGGMYPPPPIYPPPPMYPMMPPPGFGPPPRRSGGGMAVALVVVLLLLGLSAVLNLVLFGVSAVGAGAGGGSAMTETVTAGSGDQKIAIVPITGVIDGGTAKQVGTYLDAAEKDANVKAVVLEIDSPGGTVTASDEIYARLLRFKQDKKVPVIVSMGSLATSGGYYAACAGDHLFAQQTTLTGNIGVLMPRFNFSKLMDKWGVEERTIVSEGATYKNAGSTFSPESAEDTKYLQGIADSMFTRFKDVVKAGRSGQIQKLGLSVDTVADGRAFTATEAKANGLIDDIGYLGDAVAHAGKAAGGLKNPTVFRYGRPPSLLDLFAANSPLPATSRAGNLTVNGVNVNVDRKLLDELAAPRVLYLWRGE